MHGCILCLIYFPSLSKLFNQQSVIKCFKVLFSPSLCLHIPWVSLPRQEHFSCMCYSMLFCFPQGLWVALDLPIHTINLLHSRIGLWLLHHPQPLLPRLRVQTFCVALLAHGDFVLLLLLLKPYYTCTHITSISLQFGCSCTVLFGDSVSLDSLGWPLSIISSNESCSPKTPNWEEKCCSCYLKKSALYYSRIFWRRVTVQSCLSRLYSLSIIEANQFLWRESLLPDTREAAP